MLTKPKRWESKKYRDAARGQDCKMRLPGCMNDTETVVLAHRNGAGMGTKASDYDAADCCAQCHDRLDGRVEAVFASGTKMPTDEIGWYFARARLATIINRIERGILK